MPHTVRGQPSEPLRLAMLVERARKIVSVAVQSVFHFRPQHKRLAQSVAFEEGLEFCRQRDGTLFPVLKLHRGGLA